VYEKAYKLAMEVFELTKRFPAEERFLRAKFAVLRVRSVSTCEKHGRSGDTKLTSSVNSLIATEKTAKQTHR